MGIEPTSEAWFKSNIEAINLEKRKADSQGVDLLVLIGHYKDECGSDVKSSCRNTRSMCGGGTAISSRSSSTLDSG